MIGGNRKMVKKPLSCNANAFFSSHNFYGWLEIRDKSYPGLNRVKDFLLENHGFKFCRADPILCET